MLIVCPICEWKFYLKDKELVCPMCGEDLPYIIEIEDLGEQEEGDSEWKNSWTF
jgi:uncharacterized Zn finger protein (UPF0148 family)